VAIIAADLAIKLGKLSYEVIGTDELQTQNKALAMQWVESKQTEEALSAKSHPRMRF
jgi:hypothetical protein